MVAFRCSRYCKLTYIYNPTFYRGCTVKGCESTANVAQRDAAKRVARRVLGESESEGGVARKLSGSWWRELRGGS